MTKETQIIKDKILEKVLPDVIFDGWTWDTILKATKDAGYEKTMAVAVFPGHVKDTVKHFSDWADRQMLARLEGVNVEEMRIRDRIRLCVLTRLDVLLPYKEVVRKSLSYWALPPRGFAASKVLWNTSDKIWSWAGDESKDYNHYTKRGLLSGVIATTTLAWLNDEGNDLTGAEEFLDRRIENVMQLGKIIGRVKKSES